MSNSHQMPHQPRARTPNGPGMVLVVDDEPLVGEVIYRALSRRGLATLVASSPAQAIELASNWPIALLVTDLMMPGMSGLELAGRIRELHPMVPVILISGAPDAAGTVIDPPSAFLQKPVSLGELAMTVASFRPTGARVT